MPRRESQLCLPRLSLKDVFQYRPQPRTPQNKDITKTQRSITLACLSCYPLVEYRLIITTNYLLQISTQAWLLRYSKCTTKAYRLAAIMELIIKPQLLLQIWASLMSTKLKITKAALYESSQRVAAAIIIDERTLNLKVQIIAIILQGLTHNECHFSDCTTNHSLDFVAELTLHMPVHRDNSTVTLQRLILNKPLWR